MWTTFRQIYRNVGSFSLCVAYIRAIFTPYTVYDEDMDNFWANLGGKDGQTMDLQAFSRGIDLMVNGESARARSLRAVSRYSSFTLTMLAVKVLLCQRILGWFWHFQVYFKISTGVLSMVFSSVKPAPCAFPGPHCGGAPAPAVQPAVRGDAQRQQLHERDEPVGLCELHDPGDPSLRADVRGGSARALAVTVQ